MGQDLTRGVILHVEDEESQRESLATLLAVESFEVHQAADGAAVPALARKLGARLDVLIVDYHLGSSGPGRFGNGGSGTDVAEELSALLGHAIPTIMLTGDIANCEFPILRYAPVWVARKPLDPQVLLAGLPALVDFRRGVNRVSSDR
jgi:CheY-like chemotaxis protein